MAYIPDAGIPNMGTAKMVNNQKVGFDSSTSSYIVKKGTPWGDNAHLNAMPPGMDIEDQELADIRPMPFKTITAESYPGDGW